MSYTKINKRKYSHTNRENHELQRGHFRLARFAIAVTSDEAGRVSIPTTRQIKLELRLHTPKTLMYLSSKANRLVRPVKRVAYRIIATYLDASRRKRLVALGLAVLILGTTIFPMFDGLIEHKTYALSAGEAAVLSPTSESMAKALKLDTKEKAYLFNDDYHPSQSSTQIKAGGALIKAEISQDPTKGVKVTDPVNDTDFRVKPLFKLGSGKQQENRVVFPAFNGGGHLVYTAQAVGVKQDVTLDHYIGDELEYAYRMELGSTFEARLDPSGSVGVYGSSLPLNGNVSTGSDKDKALLDKARKAAKKDKLMFTIPAPVIKESGVKQSKVQAKFVIDGDKLTVQVKNLKQASYPLSIDPTVTASSATEFYFDANLETNVNVDTTNNLLERAPLTGGNLLSWTASSSTAAAHFLGSAAVYGNTLYVIGGASTTTTSNLTGTNYVEQAKINSDGSVGTFSAGNSNGLPTGGVSRFQLLAYNGYLYIMYGSSSDTTGATLNTAIYYTRVTSESYSAFSNGAQLVNWSTEATNIPTSVRYDYAATVYNGYLYIAGGRTGTSYTTGLLTDVSYSQILPSGRPGAWTSTVSLPVARFGMDLQPYNGYLYVIGGNNGGGAAGGTLTPTVRYAAITPATGALTSGAWAGSVANLVDSTGATTQAIENLGSGFTMIYNGFLYVTGGCTAVNANQSCTAVASYSQLAQINADGSLGTFFPNNFANGGTATLQRTGTPSVGYNGILYSVAGCSAMNSGSVRCATTSLTSNYTSVNSTVGDISSNRNPTALPVALYGHATTVLNGYLYVVGGCTTTSCTGTRTENYITYYALIDADGNLGSFTNNTVSTNATSLGYDKASGPDCAVTGTDRCGLAGLAVTTYNGYIYAAGGYNGGAYSNAVYYMAPNASTGATATWTKSANTFTSAVTELGLIAYNSSLYVIGGCNGTTGIGCSTYTREVQRSIIGAAGAPGAWSASGGGSTQLRLPANGRSAFGTVVYGGYIYLAGGIDSANNQLATVTRAKFDSSGNIVAATGSAWADTTASMTQPRRRTVAQAVNGYMYVIGGHNAADTTGPPGGANGTTYGDIQIGKIDTSVAGTGDVTGGVTPSSFVQSSTSTLTRRWNPAVAFGNGFMYVTGGCTAGPPPASCTTIGTINESFVVYNADNLGVNTWNNATTTGYTATAAGSATVMNGYLYYGGGCPSGSFTYTTGLCTGSTAAVQYVAIQADGTIPAGGWTTSNMTNTAGTNQTRAFGSLVSLNGSLYYIGGQVSSIGTASNSIQYSTPNTSTGAPGTWRTTTKGVIDTGSGGVARSFLTAVVYANRIYTFGGLDTASSAKNEVYFTAAMPSGGDITSNWTAATTNFTTPRRLGSVVSVGAYIYVMGGLDNGAANLSDVQVATPNTSTGQIASWSYTTSLPYARYGTTSVGANGYIYWMAGGTTLTACSADVYYASVNGNGTVSEWQRAPNVMANVRSFTASAYYKGYMYNLGGSNCTSGVTANPVQQSGQLSQAIHATYTRYVDFGTDATLRQLYVLGTNAAISGTDIDLWTIKIKTSTQANNVWGEIYTTSLSGLNVGPAYGTAITFPSLDAGGNDTGASRYWDMTFDIDQAQSFNFPDANQPSITKYDFYFSPGPGKRLRNGKTFINETQSTLDAHP